VAESRREFLRKAAVAGAVGWAAPSVLSVSSVRAGPLYGTCCGTCRALADGFVVEPDSSLDPLAPCQSPGADGRCCEEDYKRGASQARAACAAADPVSCRASVAVREVYASISPSVHKLEVGFASSCIDCGVGSTVVRDVFLLSLRSDRTYERIPVEVPQGCNVTVVVEDPRWGTAHRFLFNEQKCVDGSLVVTALRTPGMGGVEITIAQSRAGGPGCPCTPCATGGCSLPLSV
jgi:hypothetical protein